MVQCDGCGCGTSYEAAEYVAMQTWNRRHQPLNAPLTLEELRGEDSVFVCEKAEYGFGIVDGDCVYVPGCGDLCGEFMHEDYGKTWLAYRQRPKEVQNQ